MTIEERVEQCDEMIISLQAEVSALKELMRRENPGLAAQHQALSDQFRQQFLQARKQNLQR
ncbi:MAG TPA: hypothetical protein VMB85_14595 [Bryobacteraceae bacterium]|nr:hypothetical protein [Bryobacteraceae bacterium]